MLRQYFAQRCRGGNNPLRVGVVPVGAIFYIQDDGWWRDRYRGKPICRNPWIVEGFLNGTMGAARRIPETGFWEDAYCSGRSDMAIVRSLRDGRRSQIAVRLLIPHEDEGLTKGLNAYPTLPDLRFRCRKRKFAKETACRTSQQRTPARTIPHQTTLPAGVSVHAAAMSG